MASLLPLLLLTHLVGLAWAMGAATVKLTLLLRCKADRSFIPEYLKVVKPITRQLVVGLILLTASGVGWLFLGHPLTRRLVAKIVLVAAIWVLGPVIDNVAEPRFRKLAPAPGEAASNDFVRAERAYLLLEAVATGLFYVIVVMWVVF